jgi:hypothetical protein
MEKLIQVYIKGFGKMTTQADLRNHFSEYKGIEAVRIIKDYAFLVCRLVDVGF